MSNTVLYSSSNKSDNAKCGVIMSCPIERKSEKKDDPNCKSIQLIVKKGKRSIVLNKSESRKTLEVVGGELKNLQKLFESISDFKPAKIDCNANFKSGPCTNKGTSSHNGKTFDVLFPVKQINSSNLSFEAFSEWVLFPWQAKPAVYSIKFNTCSENLNADIAVYPDIEFGMGFEFKFQNEKYRAYQKNSVTDKENTGYTISRASRKKTKQLKTQSANYVTESCTPIKFSDSFTLLGFYKFSGIEIELKKVLKNYIEKVETVEKIVEPLIGLVNEIRSKENDAQEAEEENKLQKVKQGKSSNVITFPTVNVKFSGLWEELEDCPECAYGAQILVSLKPLFGLEFKYDITYAILRATGVGNTLAQVKSYLDSEGLRAFALILSTGFLVNVEGKFEWNTQAPLKETGSLDTTFPIKLEATLLKVAKRIKKFGVYAAISLEMGAKAESGIKVKVILESANVNYSIDWTGLKVVITAKQDVCVSRTEMKCAPPGAIKSKVTGNGLKEDEEKQFTFTLPGKSLDKGTLYNFS